MFTVLASSLVVLNAASPNQGFTPTDTPYMLRMRGGAGAIRNGYQEGRIRTNALDRWVVINWTASPIANQAPNYSLQWSSQHNAFGNNKAQDGFQEFSTRFHPTANCVIDSSRILVGGITPAGRTIIEEWTLGWPEAMPTPVTSTTTGIVSVAVALVTVTDTRRLFDADEVGKKYVRNLCEIRRADAPTESCIVQFHDSNDVYELNLGDSNMKLLASASISTGPLGLVVGLGAKDHYGVWFGDRLGVGYTYRLVRGHKVGPLPATGSSPPTVILVDGDRNGTIDSVLQLAAAEYQAQGWSDLANYASWWLY